MTLGTILLSAAVIFGMACGQVLFKLAAGRGSIEQVLVSWQLWAAFILYALVTVLWVLLLRKLELSKAYPVMAATYVIVPVASVLVLGEKVGPVYLVGIVLIILGIMLTTRAA